MSLSYFVATACIFSHEELTSWLQLCVSVTLCETYVFVMAKKGKDSMLGKKCWMF